jgi:ribonuclease D
MAADALSCAAMQTLYIDTPEKLHDLCWRLADAEWLALDTEFMRETTYYPRLCLLQVGTPEVTACVDPLALPDIEPLAKLIYDPAVTKVMHACSQDMEIFYHLRGTLPAPVFDTQLAAPLLGHPEQAGYGRLVEDVLGVRLAKTHTRTDWSHRPLSQAQLAYAADDVIYLGRLYVNLREELKRRGRLEWLAEDFAALSDSARYENPPELAWRRVKAAYKLRGSELAVVQALAAWRERTAQTENKPRGRLMKDDVLIDMARQKPGGRDQLGRIRGLHERSLKRYGDELLALIREFKQRTPEPLPAYVKAEDLSPEQEALADLLNAVVHLRAAEQALNPAQLAPHKALRRLVLGHEDTEVLRGWRRRLIGEELQAVLRGERSLSVVDGRLAVRSS